MSIIRGGVVESTVILSAERELFYLSDETAEASLLEIECQKAYHQGWIEGEAKGYARAVEENEKLLLLLQTLAQKVLEHKKHFLQQVKPELIEFSMRVCERVIRKELSRPEHLIHLISLLLQANAPHVEGETLSLLLAPADLVMLEPYLEQIAYDRQAISRIVFRADPSLCRGDCRLESKGSMLHYSIARELTELSSTVLQQLSVGIGIFFLWGGGLWCI
jgi:flagellar biosynthesis/type III secretory pathway protein FliH